MTDFLPATVSDSTTLGGEDSQRITFRPGVPGPISVRSVPRHIPTRSEIGLLGALTITRPGASKPVVQVRVKLGQPLLAASHQVTADELVAPGDWGVSVFNGSDETVTFDSEVTFLTEIPLEHHTATIDVGLLDLLLAEAVADAEVSWHLQSSASADQADSSITWSNAAAGFLHGQAGMQFQIPDLRIERHFDVGTLTWLVLRIENADSGSSSPVSILLTARGTVPVASFTVTFAPDRARIVAIDSDVNLDSLDIAVNIHSLKVFVELDFSGTITAASLGSADITVDGLNVADISNDLTITVPRNLNTVLAGIDAASVRAQLDSFFSLLMRLDAGARIDGYSTDGVTLTVAYSVPRRTIGTDPPADPRPAPVR
jgi:hypothetical protein